MGIEKNITFSFLDISFYAGFISYLAILIAHMHYLLYLFILLLGRKASQYLESVAVILVSLAYISIVQYAETLLLKTILSVAFLVAIRAIEKYFKVDNASNEDHYSKL